MKREIGFGENKEKLGRRSRGSGPGREEREIKKGMEKNTRRERKIMRKRKKKMGAQYK